MGDTTQIMDAIEAAVEACAAQARKGIPAGAWAVDYAAILARVTGPASPLPAPEPLANHVRQEVLA